MEEVTAWIQFQFQYVLIGLGIFVMLGAALKWQWMIEMPYSKLGGLRGFIEELHGKNARYAFERWFTFILGLLMVAVGIGYLVIG